MLRVLFREVLRLEAPSEAATASYTSLRPRAIEAGLLPLGTPAWPERAELLDRIASHDIPIQELLKAELSFTHRVTLLTELGALAEGVQRLICGVLMRALGERPAHTHRRVSGRLALASAWDASAQVWLQIREVDGVAQVTDVRLPLVPSGDRTQGSAFVAKNELWQAKFYGSAIGPSHVAPNAPTPPEGSQTS